MAGPRTLQEKILSNATVSEMRVRGQQGLQTVKKHGQVYYEQGQVYWERNKPRSTLQWLVFAGGALLALSVISTVMMIVSGFLLVAAWVGLVMFSVTVFTCTIAAVFCGWAMLLFSGFCAVVGTSILTATCGLYVAMEAASRIKQASMHYLDTMQQSTGKLQYKPQLVRAGHVGNAAQPGPDGTGAFPPSAAADDSRVDQYAGGATAGDGHGNNSSSTTTTTASAAAPKAAAALHSQLLRQAVGSS